MTIFMVQFSLKGNSVGRIALITIFTLLFAGQVFAKLDPTGGIPDPNLAYNNNGYNDALAPGAGMGNQPIVAYGEEIGNALVNFSAGAQVAEIVNNPRSEAGMTPGGRSLRRGKSLPADDNVQDIGITPVTE